MVLHEPLVAVHRRVVLPPAVGPVTVLEASACGTLGVTLAQEGAFDEARAQFERQLALNREVGYRAGEVNALANLGTVILDCADPAQLAGFYATVTGWQTTYNDDDFVFIGDGGAGVQLGFQRIDGYRPAGWPDRERHTQRSTVTNGLI